MMSFFAAFEFRKSLEQLSRSAMVLLQQATKHAKAMVPFLKPVWAFGVAFSITGYLILRLPITGDNMGQTCELLMTF